jgi:membrane-associated phospholipid phosphatase
VAYGVKAPIAACLACAGALVVLVLFAYAVAPFEHLDASLLVHFAAQPYTHGFDLAEGVAHLADPAPLLAMAALVCLLALSWGGRREALAAVGVVVGANLTTQVLKVVLSHPRYQPYAGFSQPWSDAFPSGHATAAASIAVALMLAAPPRLGPLAVIGGSAFALAVGVAVVVLQWHFASDVLAGFLVAAGWGFAALAALRLWRPPDRSRQARPSGRFAISPE